MTLGQGKHSFAGPLFRLLSAPAGTPVQFRSNVAPESWRLEHVGRNTNGAAGAGLHEEGESARVSSSFYG